MTRWAFILAVLLCGCDPAWAQTDAEWDFGIGQKDQATRGLVSYYPMGCVGTNVCDEMGANPGGVISTNIAFTYDAGAVGNGAVFSSAGAGGRIRIPAATNLSGVGALTVTAWVFVTGNNLPSYDNVIASKTTGASSAKGWSFTPYNFFALNGSGLYFGHEIKACPTGRWVFCSAVYDEAIATTNRIRLYRDGELLPVIGIYGSYLNTIQTNTLDAFIGNFDSASHPPFPGRIDEVRIYNAAKTQDEIKRLYRMGATPKGIK